VKEGNHLRATEAQERLIELLRDHMLVQQVPFYLSTLEMLRISIDYVALFLYIENITVVVDGYLGHNHTQICVGARRSGYRGVKGQKVQNYNFGRIDHRNGN
jgi:hypothetical protein